MTEVKEVTKAWAAGFFDGEGTIVIQKPGYCLLCRLYNGDKAVLEEVQSVWGDN